MAGSKDCQELGWSGLGIARAHHTGLTVNMGRPALTSGDRAWWGSREKG